MKTTKEITNEAVHPERHPPAPGWHHTDKFGDIFISPDGIAWAVQQSGQRFVNVAIKLDSSDIVQRPAIERVKRALAERRRYNLALAARK